MILGIDRVLQGHIVKNRDFAGGVGLVEPEGAAIDVRIGEIWEMLPSTRGFLNRTTRKTRKYKKVAEFVSGNDDECFVVEPGKCYQFKTVEILDVPDNIVARFNPRYNLWVNGILVYSSKADPGYRGQIGVPVINVSGVPFEIQLGSRFGQFEFHMVCGKTYSYRGQWKGARMYTQREEIQV